MANDDINPSQIPGLCDTRWLSRFPAVQKITDQWEEPKVHFQIEMSGRGDPGYTAVSLYNMFNDPQNILYFRFLLPVLEMLNFRQVILMLGSFIKS